MLNNYGHQVKYIANATIYNKGEFTFEDIPPKNASFEDLDLIEFQRQVQSEEEDGSYIIYALPGEYDLLLERVRFFTKCSKINYLK